MSKGSFCHLQGFEPSDRTLRYIEQMNDTVEMASLLDKLIGIVPFFQIFAGRGTYKSAELISTGYQITTYNWELYANALKSIPEIKRRKLEDIAGTASIYTHGKERRFWECVYNAL
ncbi:hypothetical protein [Agarivorans litoreus]|uniref:hypothetical protein n=1 Tax=Agarivorans litoreus TaxID=1510455 RepID=UPI001C7D9EA3|nr:hypothetical protein [Agarivorans litoreus]